MGVASGFNLLILLKDEKGTFYVLCMDQRLFTLFVLGILALELLFECRIVSRQKSARFSIGVCRK